MREISALDSTDGYRYEFPLRIERSPPISSRDAVGVHINIINDAAPPWYMLALLILLSSALTAPWFAVSFRRQCR